MNTTHTTPEEFSNWQSRARDMESPALLFSARDAFAAAAATEDHDPMYANRKRDEGMTYETELKRRMAKARKAAESK